MDSFSATCGIFLHCQIWLAKNYFRKARRRCFWDYHSVYPHADHLDWPWGLWIFRSEGRISEGQNVIFRLNLSRIRPKCDFLFEKINFLLILPWVSPLRPAPIDSPRLGTKQGYLVERCDRGSLPIFYWPKLSFISFISFSKYTY